MKNKWIITVFMSIILVSLSACSQVEEMLNKLLNEETSVEEASEQDDEELMEEDSDVNMEASEEEELETEFAEPASADESETAEEVEQLQAELANGLPFDERLIAQSYEILDLPNGFPFGVPYHWILVEDNSKDNARGGFSGTFCYDFPLEIDDISEYFVYFDEVTDVRHAEESEIIQTTTFMADYGFEKIDGTFDYFEDEHENMCVHMVINFEAPDVEEEYSFGEDPETMVSEEELEQWGMLEPIDHDQVENRERQRSLPDGYEAALKDLRTDGLRNTNTNDLLSIKERIRNGEVQMELFYEGYPRIFPYEWYLFEETVDWSGVWSGTFCTDFPLSQTIVKHHDMLADYYADIHEFQLNDGNESELSIVEFALNDDYGTGSWLGKSQFYIDQGHSCINVSMVFSDEILE